MGSSCYVCTNVVPSLACAAMTSLACRESACAYDLILVVISLGGKLPPCPPSPPPQYVDETLVNPSAYVAMDEEQNKPIIGTIKTRDITAAMAEQELRETQLERWGKRERWKWDDEEEA